MGVAVVVCVAWYVSTRFSVDGAGDLPVRVFWDGDVLRCWTDAMTREGALFSETSAQELGRSESGRMIEVDTAGTGRQSLRT